MATELATKRALGSQYVPYDGLVISKELNYTGNTYWRFGRERSGDKVEGQDNLVVCLGLGLNHNVPILPMGVLEYRAYLPSTLS